MDLRARGESIAMLLHHGNVEYKDTRIPWAEMADYKAASPSGQFPFLRVGEGDAQQTFVESGAIIRYVGCLAGVCPMSDPLEMLYQDQVVEIVQCIQECQPLMNFYDSEADDFAGKLDQYYEGKAGPVLTRLEKMLSEKGTTYFGGDKPLVADFHVWYQCDMLEVMKPGTLATYPKLEAMFKQLLLDSKGLVEYLKKRPKCSEVGVPGQKNLGRKLDTNKYYLELEK